MSKGEAEIDTAVELVTLTSKSVTHRPDLNVAASGWRPRERGYEYSLQQYDNTNIVQWWRRKSVYWEPCGEALCIICAEITDVE